MSGASAVVAIVTLPSTNNRVRSYTLSVALAAVGVQTPPEQDRFFVALIEMVTPGCAEGGGSDFSRSRNGRCAGPLRCCKAVSAKSRATAGPGWLAACFGAGRDAQTGDANAAATTRIANTRFNMNASRLSPSAAERSFAADPPSTGERRDAGIVGDVAGTLARIGDAARCRAPAVIAQRTVT